MKVCHALICFFFLTLQDGNIGLINAEIHSFTGTEGQNITVECPFTRTGDRKYFCTVLYEDECEEYILKMNNNRAQRGRYIMEYKNTRAGSRLYVTITQLTKSDSGHYRCGLDIPFWFDPYMEFQIIVKDAPSTSKPNLTLRPSLTSIQSASTPTTTQSFRRSSTTSFCAETTNQSEEEQTETPAGGSGVLLYVGLTLVVMLLLFPVAVLMYCKKRASKPKEHPVEIEHANVTQAKRVYEETREDGRQSRSPPVEISSIYTVAIYKPNGVKTSDDYSFAAATASRPLNKTEDDWSELVYTRCRRLTQQRPPWSCR
ncbi:hepatitis A virus cellular receptor 1 homolog isoform X1 [Thunnus albacares]|uniref:hepatitis A virus cellular receptor 1 homolog isoform X1 n=1 Tax=Thunnus albacares TaxID=8236 RepID=UPI001CF66DF9|nr:hepatitis A virus cellular receptor 1 homolog isoform X1 [Thunnus albacares]